MVIDSFLEGDLDRLACVLCWYRGNLLDIDDNREEGSDCRRESMERRRVETMGVHEGIKEIREGGKVGKEGARVVSVFSVPLLTADRHLADPGQKKLRNPRNLREE